MADVALAQAAPFPIGEFFLALLLIVLAIFLFGFLKDFFVNAVLGVIMLFALNILADVARYPGLKISITFVTVILSAFLGLAGVGLLILLRLLGIVIQ